MKIRIWTSVAWGVLVASLYSTAFSAQPQKPASTEFKTVLRSIDLKDGDTLVFLGDSITHQCLYTQYVEDYYYTRYPKVRLHFHNSGGGGDRAADALVRFDDDVAAFKPRYVTILLGRTDGCYRDFDKNIFDIYQRDMTALLDRLKAIGALAVPVTPTMHDSRAARLRGKGSEPRDTYYNGVLSLYGAWLREVAQVRGLGFVDMYSPLNQITLAERKKDANFTLIKDAVHPGEPGQVIMAAAILADMVPRSSVSSIVIQQKAGKLVATGTGKIADFKADDKGGSFTFTAKALPWVLPPEAELGCNLTHAGHRYGIESFAARNLKPGRYELKIDGQSVGTWTDSQLAFRLELEGNKKTPQYQQALHVALLNKDRNDKAVRPLRSLWAQLKIRRRQLTLHTSDAAQLAAKKAQFEKWFANEFQPGVVKLQKLAKDYEGQIYQANQPVARKYELVRVQ